MRRKLLATLFAVFCAVCSYAQKEEPKFLVDGCFFKEMPSGIEGRQMDIMILKNKEGKMLMAVRGVTLSEEDKRYAMRKEDVADADFWIREAQSREDRVMKVAVNPGKKTLIREGDKIGRFSVKDMTGRVWDNGSTEGRPLVLNFWYIGCGPCIREMPEISRWTDECPDVNFLAVTYNSADDIKDIIDSHGFRFVQIAGDSTLWNMFGITQTPTTVLIGKDGVVRKVVIGTNEQKRNDMLEAIKKLAATERAAGVEDRKVAVLPAGSEHAGRQGGEIAGVRYDVKTGDDADLVYDVVETPPAFPGGTTGLMRFLRESIKYPAEAVAKETEGRVMVSFIVDKEGAVGDVKVVRGVSPELDAEAVRVVEAMPEWKPGRNRGRAVNVRYMLPVIFRLGSGKPSALAEGASFSESV